MEQGEYVSAGYCLVRSSELVPKGVLSASPEICLFFPDSWAIEWTSDASADRLKRAAEFGIPESGLTEVAAWATGAFGKEFGWPAVFYTWDAARGARARFLPQVGDVVIIGLGLHQSQTAGFLDAARPSPPKPGYAPEGETGLFQCVSRMKPMTAGGDVAGFEVVAALYGILCESWLACGWEKECAQSLGITTNPRGLIESYPDAVRVAEFIVQNQEQGRSSPGLWLPWLIAVYPF